MSIRPDEQSPATPRDKRKRRAAWGVTFLVVAILAAVGVALLLTRYMDARVAAVRVPTSGVVVAQVDIPVATPIKPEWLGVVPWPVTALPPGAASEPAALVGQVAIVPITRGEAVLPSKLATAGARSGLATLLPAGMRAVAVRVDDVVGVAGFLHPGDRVDVIVTMQPREGVPYTSKIVLQNVKVLAVGQHLELRGKDAEKPNPVTVATLMVTGDESERLALSASKGQLLLSLRALGDEELVDTKGITPPVLFASAAQEPRVAASEPAKPRTRVAARPAPAEPAKEKQVVEILRGDLYEKRNFEAKESRR
ncbi:Flp pilus assembly protein CpaB [Anaeromyxobacter dehalogenans 2CP-1]|uniref:Flp pilus assembly protein CpaB n=2 Tax=Anaeromyxobacter dehalogenans TaxID=161493 RepID=B8JFG4_ANAD2|nr:Flp pilus assembly protein CpaB [Anaeromyxobacter dehalogenans 2CP-1]